MLAALIRDRDWAAIDSQICRVTDFNPLAEVVGDNVIRADRRSPYALISLEVPPSLQTTGAISHRVDFLNLWKVFREIGVDDTVEVNIAWIKSTLRPPASWISATMPGLSVMVCKAGAFEIITTECQPELTGMARFEASRPLFEIKPAIYD